MFALIILNLPFLFFTQLVSRNYEVQKILSQYFYYFLFLSTKINANDKYDNHVFQQEHNTYIYIEYRYIVHCDLLIINSQTNIMNPQTKKMQQKTKVLEQAIQKLRVQAKQNLAKSQASKGAQKQMYKNKALMALNKKKQYETQLNTLMNHQLQIQKLHLTTQSMKSHQQMINTMQHAVNEQKKVMKTVDADKLADLQDQMADMKFQAQYMNDMLNRNYQLDVDEDELDDELAEFEREIAMDKKKQVNVNTNTNANTNKNQQTSYKNQDIQSMLKGL